MRAKPVLFALGVALFSASATAEEGKKRRTIGEIIIDGEVQKPQVTMFINRQNLNTDAGLVLKQSFIPKIVESVDKKVF
jgi:hypothetical protein